MESVHGISVTGGSFPAEIWRLFMEPALEGTEPASFPEPTVWPEWKPFTRGEYALTYDPNATRRDGDARRRPHRAGAGSPSSRARAGLREDD